MIENEFSYQSSGGKRKNAARLFFIELIILGLGVVLIILLLAFSGTISLNSIFNGFKKDTLPTGPPPVASGSQIVPEKYQVKMSPTPTAIPGARGDISVSSEHPNFELVLVNKEALINEIKPWGLFGRYYSNSSLGTTALPLSKLEIVLTDKVQPETQYSNQELGGIYLSTKKTASDDRIKLMVYVSDNILSDNNRSITEKSGYVTQGVLHALYTITHARTAANDKVYLEEMSQEIQEISGDEEIFRIK